ncbi:NTP transferase domain-containing protein [Lacihabitans sp. CS3-21]|uniref:nucleotidyltransferase family protein n=1 Tax=Lacihabitans sp. CS3-21 TaxID=2487332 RepID=UPI0020CD7C0D|nr:nucleotidyltransferase family protein [Lacihabitans sp. CS3-21]MCP9747011.1 nucleotidyltransferase family protein [Lacihabitans sp. CS3-21]
MNIGVVILAAGESKRMGVPKQILPIFGIPMLKYLVDEVLDTEAHPVTVVVGANKTKIVPLLENIPIGIIDNPDWQKGMGSSIKMGLVGSYLITKGFDGLIFMTSDMPFVNAEVINKLIKTAREFPDKTIIASKYAGTLGIPVLYKKERFEDILDMKPEHGAKQFFNKYADEIVPVDFNLGAIDLDTKEDYYNFLQSKN